MQSAHTHKTSLLANRTGGDCPGSSPCCRPAAPTLLLSPAPPGQGKEGFPPGLTPATTGGSHSPVLEEEMNHLAQCGRARAFRNPSVGRGRAVQAVNLAAGLLEKQGPLLDGLKAERCPAHLCTVCGTRMAGAWLLWERHEAPAGRGLPGATAAHQPCITARQQSAAVCRRPGGPGWVFT